MAEEELDIAAMRNEYAQARLDEDAVDSDPLAQFRLWFTQAVQAEVPEGNAMSLATADAKGRPALRVVLLKEIDEQGFVFYTNYKSRKAKEMKENPAVSLNFFWPQLERQVRIEGKVEKVSKSDSDAYFASRPEGSRIGAWASPQSREIPDREWLEEEVKRYTEQFAGNVIPRPAHWGGYRVIPRRIEFWQGRESRLHDRIVYTRKKSGKWKISRIAP